MCRICRLAVHWDAVLLATLKWHQLKIARRFDPKGGEERGREEKREKKLAKRKLVTQTMHSVSCIRFLLGSWQMMFTEELGKDSPNRRRSPLRAKENTLLWLLQNEKWSFTAWKSQCFSPVPPLLFCLADVLQVLANFCASIDDHSCSSSLSCRFALINNMPFNLNAYLNCLRRHGIFKLLYTAQTVNLFLLTSASSVLSLFWKPHN